MEVQDSQDYCHQEYHSTAHTHTDIEHTGRSGGSCIYRIDCNRCGKLLNPAQKGEKSTKNPKQNPQETTFCCYGNTSRGAGGRERQQPQPPQMFYRVPWRTTTLEETVGGKESTEHSFPLLSNSILAKILLFWVLWSHSQPMIFPARRGGKETTSFYSFNSDKLKQQTRQILRSRK